MTNVTNRLLRTAAIAGAAAVGIAGITTPAEAQFREQDYTLRLGGFAQNSVDFDGITISASGSLGYFFTDEFEAGLRQDLNYTDVGIPGSAITGATAVYLNYHFGDVGGNLFPFIGAALGYTYGDGVNDTFFAGPEAGVKWFMGDRSQWYLFGSVEYQFFFDSGSSARNNFDDGTFVWRVGLGVLL